jgi:hypothetical protein
MANKVELILNILGLPDFSGSLRVTVWFLKSMSSISGAELNRTSYLFPLEVGERLPFFCLHR